MPMTRLPRISSTLPLVKGMFDGAAFADLRVCIILVVHGDQHQPHDNGRRFHQRHDRYHVAMQMEPQIRDRNCSYKSDRTDRSVCCSNGTCIPGIEFSLRYKKVYRE